MTYVLNFSLKSFAWIGFVFGCTFAAHANAATPDPGLDSELARAAIEYRVPFLVLHAIARIESGGVHRLPQDEDPQNDRKAPASYGVMGLRNDSWFGQSLLKAAKLTGQKSDTLILDYKANIRGAAAYLKSLADEEVANGANMKIDADTATTKNILPWMKVIERYSGIPGAEAKVYSAEIVSAMAPWLPAKAEPASYERPNIHWDPTENYGGSFHPRYIVIHTTEGPYAATISYFKNPSSSVSAHYVIRSSDGQITQMVRDDAQAWHARCWNKLAIGIEHEAHSTDGSGMTSALYASSAKLVQMLAAKFDIPLDNKHIIGHDFWETKQFLDGEHEDLGDCQDHNDPGPHWNWRGYFNLLLRASSF